MLKLIRFATLAFTTLLLFPAHAEMHDEEEAATSERNAYAYVVIGGGVGFLEDFKVDKLATSFKHAKDDRGAAWRVGAGYMFLPYVGAELNYINYLQAVSTKTDASLGEMEFKNSAQAGTLLAVLRYPVQDFAIYGKVGPAYNHQTVKSKATSTCTKGSQIEKSWDVAYGIGGEYNLIHTIAMQIEYLVTSPETSSAMINILAKF